MSVPGEDLFQKCVVRTKLDINVFLLPIQRGLLCTEVAILHICRLILVRTCMDVNTHVHDIFE